MKLGVTALVLLIGVVLMSGCGIEQTVTIDSIKISPTGKIITQNLALDGFDKVEAHYAFDLTVEQGAAFAVTVMVDEAVEPYLDVRVNDDTLIVALDSANNYSLSDNLRLDAQITLPALVGLELSGASTAHMLGIAGDQAFDAELSGASRLSGELTAGNVRLALSGASYAALHGSARTLDLAASGASDAELVDWPVDTAVVEVSGSSDADLAVSDSLAVEASGASHVTYPAGAVLEQVNASGSSTVEARR